MIHPQSIIALRSRRQFLTQRASIGEYDALYRDLQPGVSVYWQGFGDPPSLCFRAGFDDIDHNRQRQRRRDLIKGRFQGGNLGWIVPADLPLFAALYQRPLTRLSPIQGRLLALIAREGPMNIGMMKQLTGFLVKEITPALHRLQEGFLIYEDQYDGTWNRKWHLFSQMFPHIDLEALTRREALEAILPRFAYRLAAFDLPMARSYYKLPAKELSAAIHALVETGHLAQEDGLFFHPDDAGILEGQELEAPSGVFALHRNDFLVKSQAHFLKALFPACEWDTLQYLLIDGSFRGAVLGKFKNGPFVLEDIVLHLPEDEKNRRKVQILEAVYRANGSTRPLKRYDGQALNAAD